MTNTEFAALLPALRAAAIDYNREHNRRGEFRLASMYGGGIGRALAAMGLGKDAPLAELARHAVEGMPARYGVRDAAEVIWRALDVYDRTLAGE